MGHTYEGENALGCVSLPPCRNGINERWTVSGSLVVSSPYDLPSQLPQPNYRIEYANPVVGMESQYFPD